MSDTFFCVCSNAGGETRDGTGKTRGGGEGDGDGDTGGFLALAFAVALIATANSRAVASRPCCTARIIVHIKGDMPAGFFTFLPTVVVIVVVAVGVLRTPPLRFGG